MKTIRLIDDRKIEMVALDNFIFKIEFNPSLFMFCKHLYISIINLIESIVNKLYFFCFRTGL